jgi:hypothetical protein
MFYSWNAEFMEHRWGERVRIELPVRITAQPFAVRTGRLLNLSVSGAYLEVDFPMRPLSRIQVVFDQLPRAKCEAPALAAYVARRYKDGVGIEWCEFAPPTVSKLLQAFTIRRHIRLRKPDAPATIAITRLSAPLLKHGT